jgi:DNA-binding IclR family transcriptional regulator
MKNEVELTLTILECYLKYGPSISIEDLCLKTKVSKKRIKRVLSVLENRGYITKGKDSNEYMLSRKIAMLG